MRTTSTDRARAAWGSPLPDWIAALARACDETSQGRVAKRLGRSAAVINQVLARKYIAKLDPLETRVRGEFMRATVRCPVLAEISTRRCQDEQALPFSAESRLRARLAFACRACPHHRRPT